MKVQLGDALIFFITREHLAPHLGADVQMGRSVLSKVV